jgi:capsular polysaccharide biosynthesis protein
MTTARILTVKRVQSGWRIAAIITAVFWLASLAWSLTATPLYRASTKFLVYPNANLTSSRDVVSSLDTLDKRTISSTYADILDSNRVYQETIKRLKLDPAALSQVSVHSEVQANTNILVLHVEGPDPKLVTLLANNIGQNGISYIKSIYQVFDIAYLDLAVEPKEPFTPRPLVDGLIAAGIGLLAGLVVVIARELIRSPLETMRERSITDKQSLAYTRKHALHTLGEDLLKSPDEPLAFGVIQLYGLEELAEGLPEGIAATIYRTVVDKLHAMLRGDDLVARWDRLSFSVLLSSTPEAPARKTFERLLHTLKAPVEVGSGVAIPLDPVAGLAMRRADDTLESVTGRACEAVKAARTDPARLVVSL